MSEAVEATVEEQDTDLTGANQILDKYVDFPGALMPALQEIQEFYGYIPEPTVHLTAERLNIYTSQIYGVLTFYAQFHLEPRGKYIVRVCMGTACHVKGASLILQALERLLDMKAGTTTEDGNFTLESVRCLGCCGLAPVMTINDDLYGAVTQAKLPKILERYQKEAVAVEVTTGGTDQTAPSEIMAGETINA